MKIIIILKIFLIFSVLCSGALQAQQQYTSVTLVSSGCTPQAIEEMIKAINQYRSNSKNWTTNVTQPEFTLGGVSESERGLLVLPIDKQLMFSAGETARKFADGTYPVWDHDVNGQGATMRAIKDGWSPSMNELFYANNYPVFTMLNENLYVGSYDYRWQDVFKAWKYSPGHNTTLLSRAAKSIGCGCADTKADASGERSTYWVLLVEIEDAASESDDIMREYFRRNVFYKKKDTMKNADESKYKAYEVFEFIENGLKRIRSEK
jgi:hypothetical protein